MLPKPCEIEREEICRKRSNQAFGLGEYNVARPVFITRQKKNGEQMKKTT